MQPGAEKRTFKIRLVRQREGYWLATCGAPVCLARGKSEDDVLDRIRAEIRYRIEWCPCTGVGEDYVLLDVERG
jgi:hypothetical protein